MRNYIQDKICTPLDLALNDAYPGVDIDGYQLHLRGTIWYVNDKKGQGELLYKMLKPYLEEYLFHPERRMCDGEVRITKYR